MSSYDTSTPEGRMRDDAEQHYINTGEKVNPDKTKSLKSISCPECKMKTVDLGVHYQEHHPELQQPREAKIICPQKIASKLKDLRKESGIEEVPNIIIIWLNIN